MANNVEFKYLSAELYRHPGERAARDRLEKVPGFKKALEMLTDNSGIQAERQAEIASMARVGPGVYPLLADLWNDIQSQFGLHGVPLHLSCDARQPCSIRGGEHNPRIVLDCRLLTELPEREMAALLAMQAGSIRLGNAALLAAADFSRWFLDFYGIAGAPAFLPAWGMENWRRYALFSADRAASLSQGDPEAVASLLARFAGAGQTAWGGLTRPDDLRVQGIEALSLQADWSNSRMRRFALAMNRQNTVALIRRVDLLDWFSSGVPARILSGEISEPESADSVSAADGSEGVRDPSLAYWGEFANADCEPGPGSEHGRDCTCPFCELKGAAERGIGTFFKAGEAFWNALTDNNRK